MADISMCANQSCPSREKCYRFTAPVNEFWQSYMQRKVPEGLDKCEFFWDNSNRQVKTKEK